MSDFAHRLTLDRIGSGDRIDLIADEAERAAVAERLDLLSLDRLEAHAVLTRDGEAVSASGRVKATLDQACAATGAPVPARIDEAFELKFMPSPGSTREEEVELAPGELDMVFYDGGAIDLGSAIADTLGLALDPYPRSPSADEALKAAGVLNEEQAGPFAALAALKGKMAGE